MKKIWLFVSVITLVALYPSRAWAICQKCDFHMVPGQPMCKTLQATEDGATMSVCYISTTAEGDQYCDNGGTTEGAECNHGTGRPGGGKTKTDPFQTEGVDTPCKANILGCPAECSNC